MAYTDIDDPSAYFQTTLYTGTGSSLTVTNGGNSDLQPDLVWLKSRGITEGHFWTDSVRGVQKTIRSYRTNAEETESQGLTAFNSDGFTIGTNSDINTNTDLNVAWQWKAGDTNTSVSASGSGNGAYNACTHRANTTAGFSIIKYTGLNSEISNGQHTRVTHGLGVKPDFLIIKDRDGSSNWVVTRGIDNDNHKVLNTTAAESGSLFTGDQRSNTSTYFHVGNEGAVNANGNEFIAYCFAEKQGYSKFGSYAGNSTDNDDNFQYCGFSPAWVMIKCTSATESWVIFDTKRNGFNPDNDELYADGTGAETSTEAVDFLSNGFNPYKGTGTVNRSGKSYIFMAFAEHPFVTSTGVPATAR